MHDDFYNLLLENSLVKLLIINIIAIVLGVILLPSLYVKATMNALGDSYVLGINEFKEPFYYIYNIEIKILIVLFIISLLRRFIFKQGFILANKISLSFLIVSGFVLILGIFPCFQEHVAPHTLDSTIREALLCPNYSIRSEIILIITSLLSGLTFITSLVSSVDEMDK